MIIQHTENVLPLRTRLPVAVIIHQTGATDAKAVQRFYHKSDEKLCPHYYIDENGGDYEIADPAKWVAWHAAIHEPEADKYRLGYNEWSTWHWSPTIGLYHIGQEMAGYRTWRDTWLHRGVKSPLDLVTGRYPNFVSVGIEVQTLVHPTAIVFTAGQYEALALRVSAVCKQFKIPLDRDHVLSHYDVNPMVRSHEIHGGTDPGERFDWNHLWDLIAMVRKGAR